MIISIIVAMSDNRVIGVNNKLPWKLPSDMRWFRQNTLGKPILMGRKTFLSLGAKPLPGRKNIVITHNKKYIAQDCTVAHSIDEALRVAEDAQEMVVIGGALLYEQILPQIQRMYLTRVHTVVEGDVWFPEFDLNQWQEVEHIDCKADERNPFAHTFMVLERL